MINRPTNSDTSMDTTIIAAVAAACGSLVGATVTVATTWITQRAQRAHAEWEQTRRNREALYGEFITEASRLTMEALCNSLERPDTFVKLYGITGRIRLASTGVVLAAAEACIRQIIDLYAKPNMTVEQMRMAFEREGLDPIKDFSVVCRTELFDGNLASAS